METIKEKKIAFDLFSGKNAEYLFINRVDRDIFDFKYHNNIKSNFEYELSKMNKDISKDDKSFFVMIAFAPKNIFKKIFISFYFSI